MRLKRKSKAIEKARKRLAGLESIDPNLDLGNGLGTASYKAVIEALETDLDKYNTQLSDAATS